MDTLPRFRLPDESSSRDVSKVSGAWSDFDDIDKLETRVLTRVSKSADFSDAMPTIVRPRLKKGLRAVTSANVDDVVEELRAAAAGRSSKVRELTSDDLLEEIPDADEVQEVDVGELVFDRLAGSRDVWNVHHALSASLAGRSSRGMIAGPREVPTRFLATAALAMLLGGLLAVVAALALWKLTGLSL